MEIIMQEKEQDILLQFSGVLNETFENLEDVKIFNEIRTKKEAKNIIINIKKLTSGNSSGLLLFIKTLDSLKKKVILQEVPEWMVWQLNMLSEFFQRDIFVESIEVPYVTPTGNIKMVLFKLGEEIPFPVDWNQFEFPSLEKNKETWQPDVDNDYILFIQYLERNLKKG